VTRPRAGDVMPIVLGLTNWLIAGSLPSGDQFEGIVKCIERDTAL
jgi:hypothetical protein